MFNISYELSCCTIVNNCKFFKILVAAINTFTSGTINIRCQSDKRDLRSLRAVHLLLRSRADSHKMDNFWGRSKSPPLLGSSKIHYFGEIIFNLGICERSSPH